MKKIHSRNVGAILHLCADSDYYGNPQRGYLVLSKKGQSIAYVDEGYVGVYALQSVIKDYDEASRYKIVDDVYTPRKLPYPIYIKTNPGTLRKWRNKQWE